MDEIQQRHRKEMIDFFYHLKTLSQQRLKKIITERYEIIKEYIEKVKEITNLKSYGTLTRNIEILYNCFGLNVTSMGYIYHNDDRYGSIIGRHVNNITDSLYTFIQQNKIHTIEPKSEYNIFFSFTMEKPNASIQNIYTEQILQQTYPILFENDYYNKFPITPYVSGVFDIYSTSTILNYIIEYFLVVIQLVDNPELINKDHMWTPYGNTNRKFGEYDSIKNVENNLFPTIIETCVEKGIPEYIVLYIVNMDERIKKTFYESLTYGKFNPKI